MSGFCVVATARISSSVNDCAPLDRLTCVIKRLKMNILKKAYYMGALEV